MRPSPFTPVRVELLSDGVNIQVLEYFTYTDSTGTVWPVPAGTISDGASIPRALWSEIGCPLTGKYRRAAIVHDYLYHSHLTTREKADWVLRDGSIADGCSDILADIIYEAVRAGGGPHWVETSALTNTGT